MDTLTMDELRELASPKEGWCVSIFMPTNFMSQEVRQNTIRYKNLLDQARDRLVSEHQAESEIEELFAPANNLLKEELFWQRQNQGLAVFLSSGFFRFYQLPASVEEQVLINDHFHLKPLLSLLGKDEEFYILAISQNQVRLLKATEHEVEQVHPPEMPKNMQTALGYDEFQSDLLQWHSGTGQAARGGGRQAIFHGHGEGDDNRKDYILNYLRTVDKAVTGYLKDNKAPLILAGVEYLQPLYKEANTYQHLAEEFIPGSPEGTKDTELRDKAWKQIKPIFQTVKHNRVERYRMLSGRRDPLAVKDIAQIVRYAPYGRIDVLFVDKHARRWGSFDQSSNKVKFYEEQRPGSQDLLDFAAVQTLLNGGEVIAVDREELPDQGSPITAIFRY